MPNWLVPSLILSLLILLLAVWLQWRARSRAEQALQLQQQRHDSLYQQWEQLTSQQDTLRSEHRQQQQALSDARSDLATAEATLTATQEQLQQWRSRHDQLVQRLDQQQDAHQQQLEQLRDQHEQALTRLHQQLADQQAQLAQTHTQLSAEREQAQEKLALLHEARTALSDQFKAVASELLTHTGEQLTQHQQRSLASLIDPFKERLGEFKTRVEELHRLETGERARLSEQVHQLMQASANVSKEAHALTQALKSDSRTQGSWGELVLERLLEQAGLREGHEYTTQSSHTDHAGSGNRQRPDIIVNLPGDKHLIIDAKVSLTAYERLANASDEASRTQALRDHLTSVRNHIRQLGEKNYPAITGLNSPDFVMLFMPLEPALLAAVQSDERLFLDAWNRNVLLTSPSTLLFALRTVAQLWRNEQQQRNVAAIVERGTLMLDKLNGFAEDLDKVGNALGSAQRAHEQALTKFQGNGGLLSQATKLTKLGLTPKKPLPQLEGEQDS